MIDTPAASLQWNKGTKDQYETDVKGSWLLSLELYWCN